MRREDLRVNRIVPKESCGDSGRKITEVSDAELAELVESMGYVKRPVCGCVITARNGIKIPNLECPSCGGSGFGRLVALDGIDVEALKRSLRPDRMHGACNVWYRVARQVLAAIHGEDTP